MAETHSSDNPAEEKGAFWRDPPLGQVEALLFVGREPLPSRKIAQLAGLAEAAEARTLIRRLNRMYDAGGSVFRVEEVAGGFQLLTRPKFGAWLRKLLQTPVEARLSGPAMETLAVVAYRQPALRAEIEAVRGVQCGDILRQLMERDLVRIVGRSDDLGRPLLYGTTKRFLELFGLRHLDELPRAAEFRAMHDASGAGGVSDDSPDGNEPGTGRDDGILSNDRISEEESVTTRIRPETVREETNEEPLLTLLEAARRQAGGKPIAAAADNGEEEADEEDEDEDDDDWEDDDDEEGEDDEDEEEDDEDEEDEDDDFVDEEWEEVDDDDIEDDDDEDEEDDDEEDDEDWDDDDEEEEEEVADDKE